MKPCIWAQFGVAGLVGFLLAAPAWSQGAPDDVPEPSSSVQETSPTPTQLPIAIDPPPAPPNPAIVVNHVWAQRPTAQDFARYYPAEAFRQGVSGRATLECIVADDGRLSCTVFSESPEGAGFGEAALRVSRHFRMAPATRDGTPTAGGRVRIPIRFALS